MDVLDPEPRETAERCGLTYVQPDTPGYSRRRRGRGFSFHTPDGQVVRDDAVLRRFESLAVPPAWGDVWICCSEDGHLQAAGTDEAGRKQYLYHERFREARELVKFDRLLPFGTRLPALRRRVGRDLKRSGMPREKVLAAGVRVLDQASIRVGNAEYARSNQTFGLTTLRRKHVAIRRGKVVLEFAGKGGRDVEVELTDPDLVDVLRECDRLPGYRLFQYLSDDGTKLTVTSEDVNGYLREGMCAPFTAKDFRTWAGTTSAIAYLAGEEASDDEAARRSTIVAMSGAVADVLHNTPAVARQSYVHPVVEELYLAGAFHERLASARKREAEFRTPGRRRDERVALALLEDVTDG